MNPADFFDSVGLIAQNQYTNYIATSIDVAIKRSLPGNAE
jgi:hypothetical protein